MGEKALTHYSYEAYRTLEAESDSKYEYHDGLIVAMAGGSPEHGQIAANFIRSVGNALVAKDKPCIVYSSDVKIRIKTSNRSYYPDASIICDTPERSKDDPQAIVNPVLILEVLSDTTAAFDRGAKFAHYRQLSSLKEYILISQDEAMIDTYFRTSDNTWEIQTFTSLDAMIHLKSLDSTLAMSEIYRLVPGIARD